MPCKVTRAFLFVRQLRCPCVRVFARPYHFRSETTFLCAPLFLPFMLVGHYIVILSAPLLDVFVLRYTIRCSTINYYVRTYPLLHDKFGCSRQPVALRSGARSLNTYSSQQLRYIIHSLMNVAPHQSGRYVRVRTTTVRDIQQLSRHLKPSQQQCRPVGDPHPPVPFVLYYIV